MEPQFGDSGGAAAWRRVTALLDQSAASGRVPVVGPKQVKGIADGTLSASAEELERARRDEGVAFIFYLLIRVVRASRGPDFVGGLAGLDFGPPMAARLDPRLEVPDPKRLAENLQQLLAGFVHCGDRHMKAAGGHTPASEMALRAAPQSLIALCAERSVTLFGSSEETVRAALRPLASRRGFGRLSRHFFGRLIHQHVLYYLDRKLRTYDGEARHFGIIADYVGFHRDMDNHCQTAAKAVRPFAECWYSRHGFANGVTIEKAGRFVNQAVGHMREAMRYEEGRHGG